MNRYLHVMLSMMTFAAVIDSAHAQQATLAAGQNPRYEQSRDKYMGTADSINSWHSTTSQETYRAIDYLADKAEAREQRRAFRRELRLERARYGYGWNDDYGYYSNSNAGYYPVGYYNNSYNNSYGNSYYRNGYYSRNRSFYNRPYRNNYFWNSLPLAFALGWCWR
ncbi:MAG TPA: hypothetical protein VK616_05640 [Flavitalea sp.]|nr:hypothetical protein [Flavitalea sp.]